MEGKLDLLLFDNLNNILEKISINKPKTYYELLEVIKIKMKSLPKNFIIVYEKNNKKVKTNNNEKYKLAEDIFLFVKKIILKISNTACS